VTIPVSVEYDEMGGYDGMSSAYFINDSSGKRLATVDTRDFGGGDCDWKEYPEARSSGAYCGVFERAGHGISTKGWHMNYSPTGSANLTQEQLERAATLFETMTVPDDARMLWDGHQWLAIPSEQESFANQLFSPDGMRRLFNL